MMIMMADFMNLPMTISIAVTIIVEIILGVDPSLGHFIQTTNHTK